MSPALLYPILRQNCLTAKAAGWTFVEGFGLSSDKTCCAVSAGQSYGTITELVHKLCSEYEITPGQLYGIMWGFDGVVFTEPSNFYSLGQRLREEFRPIK